YLPFRYEISDWLRSADNVLSVAVDSRWTNVPPGSPDGKARIDYLAPGGIYRSVRLEAVPHAFISDVFAKPVSVGDPGRRVDVLSAVDTAGLVPEPLEIEVALRQGDRVLSRARQRLETGPLTGPRYVAQTLSNLRDITLWDVNAPHLYSVV